MPRRIAALGMGPAATWRPLPAAGLPVWNRDATSLRETVVHEGCQAELYNAIGTARMLVNTSGTVTDSYHLDAWGHHFSSTGSTVNPYRYGAAWGYITDPSGMLQLGARFYWPELGRFVQRDPAKEGVNWYSYVGNGPTAGIDATGLGRTMTGPMRPASFDKAGFLGCLKTAFVKPVSPAGIQNWADCTMCAVGLASGTISGGIGGVLSSPVCVKCAAYSTFMFFYCLFTNIDYGCPPSGYYGPPQPGYYGPPPPAPGTGEWISGSGPGGKTWVYY